MRALFSLAQASCRLGLFVVSASLLAVVLVTPGDIQAIASAASLSRAIARHQPHQECRPRVTVLTAITPVVKSVYLSCERDTMGSRRGSASITAGALTALIRGHSDGI